MDGDTVISLEKESERARTQKCQRNKRASERVNECARERERARERESEREREREREREGKREKDRERKSERVSERHTERGMEGGMEGGGREAGRRAGRGSARARARQRSSERLHSTTGALRSRAPHQCSERSITHRTSNISSTPLTSTSHSGAPPAVPFPVAEKTRSSPGDSVHAHARNESNERQCQDLKKQR